ncbi:MAG: hypothetical protein M1829_006368 [Trizodia sp. TS-e1964]|nr:MAG: hypothetical protein M1829_006368 [Trizodia sp. TS-e1964]
MARPEISISLENGEQQPAQSTRSTSYMATYTTNDVIRGSVTIRGVGFDNLKITLEGTASTSIERMGPTPVSPRPRLTAKQTFLRVLQPIDPSLFPTGTEAKPQTYSYPFEFTVPAALLPQACSHPSIQDSIREPHLLLPPSMGDRAVAGTSRSTFSDLSPTIARISYAIHARASTHRPSDNKVVTVSETLQKVRILPGREEQPPLAVEDTGDEYTFRRDRLIRTHWLGAKRGRLVVQASQPRSVQLTSDESGTWSGSSVATLQLRFDPATSQTPPPCLSHLTSKLRALTFFSATPMRDIPTQSSVTLDSARGVYIASVPLSSRAIAGVKWQQHAREDDDEGAIRRDSAFSTCSAPPECVKASKGYQGGVFYTAHVVVPIALPTNKSWVPSFASCVVARVYRLDLSLELNGRWGRGVGVKIPLQIGLGAGKKEVEEHSEEREEIEGFFRPRNVTPPTEVLSEVIGRLPPGYASVFVAQISA